MACGSLHLGSSHTRRLEHRIFQVFLFSSRMDMTSPSASTAALESSLCVFSLASHRFLALHWFSGFTGFQGTVILPVPQRCPFYDCLLLLPSPLPSFVVNVPQCSVLSVNCSDFSMVIQECSYMMQPWPSWLSESLPVCVCGGGGYILRHSMKRKY